MNLRETYEHPENKKLFSSYEAFLEHHLQQKMEQAKTMSKDIAEAFTKIGELERHAAKRYSIGFKEGQVVEKINGEVLLSAHESAECLINVLACMYDVELEEHPQAEEIKTSIALQIQGYRINQ